MLMLEKREAIEDSWQTLQPILQVNNEESYDRALETVEWLMQEVGEDDGHALFGLMAVLVDAIERYEAVVHPMPDCSGIDALKFLMEEHGLKQVDLPELGSQGVVSQILNGKRELNKRQIVALTKRFGVSAETLPSFFTSVIDS